MNEEVRSINRKMTIGAAWMVAFKVMDKSIGLVSTIILARLLMPEDFGLVAMAMIVVAFTELLSAFNFDIALIQKSDSTSEHYNTAWTFNVLLSILLGLLLVLFAPLASEFYEESRLRNVLFVLAIYVALSGLENIGVIAFRKELAFHKEFFYLLGKKLISFVAAITLAILLRNYWALVGGMLAGRLGVVVLSYYVHPYRPRLCLKKYKELIGFSSWVLFNNFLFFLQQKAPDTIIGKLIGTGGLGIYTISYEISNMPTTELVAPINRAVFPGYSKLKDDLNALKESFMGTISVIALLSIPAAVGIAAIAPLFVSVVLGDKWIEAIPVIQIVSFSGLLLALNTNSGAIFLALGKPNIISTIYTFKVMLLLLSVYYLTLSNGLSGAALAVLLTSCVTVPVVVVTTLRLLRASMLSYLGVICRPLLASLVMFFAVNYYVGMVGLNEAAIENTLHLLLAILIGAIVYSFMVFALWIIMKRPHGAELHVLKYVNKYLKIRFKRLNR